MSTDKPNSTVDLDIGLLDLIDNTRTNINGNDLTELIESIKQNGVITPVLVRPHGKRFQVIAGKRRFMASTKAEMKTIPAYVRDVKDEDVPQLQIIENLHRKDISPLEEAVAYKRLTAVKKIDQKELSLLVGKSQNYVANRLKLNDLIPELQQAMIDGLLQFKEAVKFFPLTAEDQKRYYKKNGKPGKSLSIDNYEIQGFMNDLTDAPFSTTDPELNPKMGACTTCPFNTASNTVLFPDAATFAKCTKAECFQGKCKASFAQSLKTAIENPDMALISTNYSLAAEGQQIAKKGTPVYSRYQYSAVQPPAVPDLEDFEVSDYDSEKLMNEAIEEANQEYIKRKGDYEKKVSTGKYVQAFVVEGDDKGKIRYVTIEKESSTSSSKSSGTGDEKKAPAEMSASQLKEEIKRIQDREARNKELDFEKVTDSLKDILSESEKQILTPKKLSYLERGSLLLSLCRWDDELLDVLKIKERDDQAAMIEAFAKLDDLKASVIFRFYMEHEFTNQGHLNRLSDYQAHGVRHIAESIGVDVKKIQKDQDEVAKARQERMTVRIKKLNDLLKETPAKKPAKKSTTKKSPAKKAAKKKK